MCDNAHTIPKEGFYLYKKNLFFHISEKIPIFIEFCKSLEITIKELKGTGKRKLVKSLGNGGTKRAYKLDDGRAILFVRCRHKVGCWKTLVECEVNSSRVLTKLGLLNPQLEKVEISFVTEKQNYQLDLDREQMELLDLKEEKIEILCNEKEHTFPAFVCQSFDPLAKQGIYVIDSKNSHSSMWDCKKQQIFNSDEERLKVENWDPIVKPLLEDIKKIVDYDIPTGIDSLNMAIQKTEAGHAIRYFGFDFDSAQLKEEPVNYLSLNDKKKKASKILDRLLGDALSMEFYMYITENEKEKCLWDSENLKDFYFKKNKYRKMEYEKFEKELVLKYTEVLENSFSK